MLWIAVALALAQTGSDPDSTLRIDSDRSTQWESGPWRVFPYPDEGTCDLGYSAPNGEYVTIAYSARSKQVRLLITNSNATSKEAGDKVVLNVVFLRGEKMTDLYENTDFETHVQGDTRVFISEALALDFFDAFAANDYLVAMTPHNVGVAALKLSGSSEAVRQLRTCGLRAAGLNPNDPFLK